MSKLAQIGAAALFAALAAASFIGFAGAASENVAAGPETCELATCFIAIF